MSSFQLKCIAMIAMCIDHVGAVLFPQIRILRIIGRISFPIFCFLLVEGFYHTRNIHRYFLRLFLAGLVSEPIFDQVFTGKWFYPKAGNVFFTLCVGLAFMYICQHMQSKVEQGLVFGAVLMLSQYIPMDYGMYGIAMIGGFYFLRKAKLANFCYQMLITRVLGNTLQLFCGAGCLLTIFYNGKKGYQRAGYAFYILYPLHLWVLWLIQLAV